MTAPTKVNRLSDTAVSAVTGKNVDSEDEPRRSKIRIAFLIRSLNLGGTERQLIELVTGLDRDAFDITVLTFYPGGAIWDELLSHSDIRLICLFKRGRWDTLRFACVLTLTLRQLNVEILHCFLIEPSIFGLLVRRWVGVPAIVWGIRASSVQYSEYGVTSSLTFKLSAVLSPFVDQIVANSVAGRSDHIQHGYSPRRFDVIPNGIATDRFWPSNKARHRTRREWGFSDDDVVVGMVARLDPVKGHPIFLEAAQKLVRRFSNVRLVCVGSGSPTYMARLRDLGQSLERSGRLIWTGEILCMSITYPAFDVLCSASVCEGFSNAIAEAMAAGVPCVVTDVGDSAQIVGSTGFVVPPDDPEALANAVAAVIGMPLSKRAELGQRARERIASSYGRRSMIERTEGLYFRLAQRSDGSTG